MSHLLRQLSPVLRHAGGLHALHVHMTRGMQMEGHVHNEPTIVVLIEGDLHVTEGACEVLETTGTVRLSPPGITRSLRTNDGAECLVISCNCAHAVARHAIWRQLPDRTSTRYCGGPHVTALIDRVRVPECSATEFESLCLDVLTALMREREPLPATPPWLEHALTALTATAGRKGAGRSVARDIGVHPVHLARVVRRFTGLTLRDYLRRERIVRGARMLRSSDGSLSSVAYQAGFADHSHFTREFMRRYGHAPSEALLRPSSDVVSIQASAFPAVHLGQLSLRPDIRDGDAAWDGKEPLKA